MQGSHQNFKLLNFLVYVVEVVMDMTFVSLVCEKYDTSYTTVVPVILHGNGRFAFLSPFGGLGQRTMFILGSLEIA